MRKLSIREILVMMSGYVRPNTLCKGWGEGREQDVSPSGGVCYIYLAGNRARNGMAIIVAFKIILYVIIIIITLGTGFQLFHSIMIL